MNVAIAPAPVRKTVRVKVSIDKAFAVFTEGIGRWWPKSHSVADAPQMDVIIEPFVKGRWYERGAEGVESPWGHVLVWEPPARVVLAWQLDAEWKFDPDLVTEVEARFFDEGGTTRVEFEHRNLERFGDRAAKVRDAIGAANGWPGILDEFAKAAEATPF
jgi:uncharacterized protein YndB with AHSA1/START domain